MYGDDWEYAGSRLNGSVVRINNSPVLVREVGPENVRVIKLSTQRESRVKLADLDVSAIGLGYINTPRGCAYLSRQPRRRDWRQGIRRGNTNVTFGDWIFTTQDIEFGKGLESLCKNKFPSFKSALENSKKGNVNLAFHKHWAVTPAGQILYRNGLVVGQVTGGVCNLMDGNTHLKEYLEECCG